VEVKANYVRTGTNNDKKVLENEILCYSISREGGISFSEGGGGGGGGDIGFGTIYRPLTLYNFFLSMISIGGGGSVGLY
jgi:hypothetical protein